MYGVKTDISSLCRKLLKNCCQTTVSNLLNSPKDCFWCALVFWMETRIITKRTILVGGNAQLDHYSL